MVDVVVNVEDAARKLLRDPEGLAHVNVTELRALAQYALKPVPEHAISASLAAAIQAVIRESRALHHADISAPSADAAVKQQAVLCLQSRILHLKGHFEKEFPNGTAD